MAGRTTPPQGHDAVAMAGAISHSSTMSTAELKNYVEARTPDERRWLARFLWEMERQSDEAHLAELDRRMKDMDAGKNRVTWEELQARLDESERQGG